MGWRGESERAGRGCVGHVSFHLDIHRFVFFSPLCLRQEVRCKGRWAL